MSESFAELFEESLKTLDMEPGSIITGIVVDIDSDWVTVHAGLKSEGVIPRDQFLDEQGELTIAVGDEVHVALDAVEDGFGETKLSREKAKRAESWKVLEAAFAAEEVVKGVINGKVKGGFTVDVNTIRAFLPGSLVDVRPVRDTTHLENKELEFKVIKLDQKRNNVVVSRRAVLEAENSAEREALLETLQEGQVVKGIVKNLTDYGAFVDLGGVDGLLHITDMAWKRIKHPSEIVNVGDEIDVKVLKFDRERNRVSLGLKQLGEDPWVAITGRYPEGTRVTAKVTNLTDYGCFAELEEVAYVQLDELAMIEGFDEELAEELQSRATEALERQEAAHREARRELGVEDALAELPHLTEAMLVTLGKAGVKTLDDLADLATDELIQKKREAPRRRNNADGPPMRRPSVREQDKGGVLGEYGLSEEQGNEIIMAARAHWFEDEEPAKPATASEGADQEAADADSEQ